MRCQRPSVFGSARRWERGRTGGGGGGGDQAGNRTSVERRLKDEEPEPEPEGRSEASPPGLSAKPSPPPLRPITGDGRGALGELMTSRTASYHHNPHGCKSELKGALGGGNRTVEDPLAAWIMHRDDLELSPCCRYFVTRLSVRQGRRDLQNSVNYDLHACVAGRKHARRFACGSE